MGAKKKKKIIIIIKNKNKTKINKGNKILNKSCSKLCELPRKHVLFGKWGGGSIDNQTDRHAHIA